MDHQTSAAQDPAALNETTLHSFYVLKHVAGKNEIE
jgi:hypothetical protein